MPPKDQAKAAFGIYPKQRATLSSKETKDGMAEAAKFAAEMLIPQTPFDAGLMLIPGGGVARKAGAALMALNAGDAEAGGLSSLMKLIAKEAPAQARVIREALGKSYSKDLEHSVIGSSDKGPAGSIMSGNWDGVSPNQLDIQRALRSNKPIVDFHTHPQGAQAAFDVAPSEGDFRFYSNEYFPGSKGRELRTIIASPATNKTPTSYSFFATDNPSNVFDRRTLNNAVYELQRTGSKGTFKSVMDDPRFREYFDAGGTIGDLAENIAPLSLLDLRKSQGLGRGELGLSGRKLSQNQGSSNIDLFNLMNPPAVEFLTRKGFAAGGIVADEDLTRPAFRTPLVLKRSEARQDREASANIPLAAARGFVAGTLGMPGDIEGLIRLITPGVSNESFLPTSEQFLKSLPLNQDTPVSRAFGELGTIAGSPVLLKAVPTLARAGKAGARLVGEELNRALLDNSGALSKLIPEAVKPMYVVKPKGGNWLAGGVEGMTKGLKSGPVQMDRFAVRDAMSPDDLGRYFAAADTPGVTDPASQLKAAGLYEKYANPPSAVNTWIDKTLNQYIKNDMATPEDPVRLLADAWPAKRDLKLAEKQKQMDKLLVKLGTSDPRAHAGINRDIDAVRGQMDVIGEYQPLHTLGVVNDSQWSRDYLEGIRKEAGFPTGGMGVSEQAKAWERLADDATNVTTARRHSESSSIRSAAERKDNPWLAKVPPETAVYAPGPHGELGLNHLVDELRNATNAASGLPRNLLIDPADLSKITMKQAVTRVADINAWRMAQKVEANMSLANNAATTVFKEYAENNPKGLKWVQLKRGEGKKPTDWDNFTPDEQKNYLSLPDTQGTDELAAALKYEGDTMGHCVGGYCPDVIEGKRRIYSLRDAKGQPHVTVEVEPGRLSGKNSLDEWKARYAETHGPDAVEPFLAEHPEIAEAFVPSITQIKGKGNRKPNDEYQPFVQDFVKSGKWGDVGDLGNTGLTRLPDKRFITKEQFDEGIQRMTGEGEPSVNSEWFQRQINKDPSWWENVKGAFEGFARGGPVSFAKGGSVSTYTEYNPALVGAMVHDLQEELYAN